MRNGITRTIKLAAAGLTFLFCATSLQAAPMPIADHSFGLLVGGTHSHSDFLPDTNPVEPNALWFEFMLGTESHVQLLTLGSFEDTVLALYDNSGAVLGENDDCPSGGTLTSCLTFASLGAGTYLAAIAGFPAGFFDMWEALFTDDSDELVTLNIEVRALNLNPVPVPAAVWLFGSALIGFVGMSRRTSIKT